MKMRIGVVSFLGAIVFLFVSEQIVFASDLVEKYSDSELVKILKNDGYSSVNSERDGVILIKINGTGYVLLNKDDGDLQTVYMASGVDVSCRDINKWNRTKRLSRAYLDGDNDPVLEADLLANGGLSKKHVTEFVRVFVMSTKRFKEFLMDSDKD